MFYSLIKESKREIFIADNKLKIWNSKILERAWGTETRRNTPQSLTRSPASCQTLVPLRQQTCLARISLPAFRLLFWGDKKNNAAELCLRTVHRSGYNYTFGPWNWRTSILTVSDPPASHSSSLVHHSYSNSAAEAHMLAAAQRQDFWVELVASSLGLAQIAIQLWSVHLCLVFGRWTLEIEMH